MSIRRSIKAVALEFLTKNLGDTVRREDIESYVRNVRGTSSAGEVTRRIRDLRREGWEIETNSTSGGLRPGEYRLASITKHDASDRRPERKLGSLLNEIVERPESDLREIYEVVARRLGEQ